MASLQDSQTERISAQILQELSRTPYGCSSLTELDGGSVNFVFRGVLDRSLTSNDETLSIMASVHTVIVKHSTNFLSCNWAFQLDVSRCFVEESMLKALHNFRPPNTTVKTPHLHFFNRYTNTQVLENFEGADDLKSILDSSIANTVLSRSLATSIGRSIGVWYRLFRSWATAPAQAHLLIGFGGNESMRRLKYRATYESFVKILETFPNMLDESSRKTLESVQAMATDEFARAAGGDLDEGWGLIHGDLWTGNILLPPPPTPEGQYREPTDLVIIDWEYAQFGHEAYDLGQIVGDLVERWHFKGVDCALWILEGLVDGLGGLDDQLAFRTAIHAGVHLIHWYSRGPPTGPRFEDTRRIAGAMRLGMDLVVKGWQKERSWLAGSVMAPLFEKRPEVNEP